MGTSQLCEPVFRDYNSSVTMIANSQRPALAHPTECRAAAACAMHWHSTLGLAHIYSYCIRATCSNDVSCVAVHAAKDLSYNEEMITIG